MERDPFVVVGAGMIGVDSPRAELGRDVDLSVHFGGGAKVYLNRQLALRLDLRDFITRHYGIHSAFTAHELQVTLGLSATLGRGVEGPPRRPRSWG